MGLTFAYFKFTDLSDLSGKVRTFNYYALLNENLLSKN